MGDAEATTNKRRHSGLPVAIILPATLSVVLFLLTLFLLVLPALESTLLSQRRETIRQLNEVAWSALAFYQKKEEQGALSRQAAQAAAIEHVKNLRYGVDSKDYFWINDMVPRLIMHPYRPDLVGRDVSEFADPDGKKLFKEFVTVVRKNGSGYVDYKWQWMDEPERIVQKISFVKRFPPWNWVIGTGLYIDDIRAEIAAITHKLTLICLAILLLVSLLSAFIIWQAIRVERKRLQAEEKSRLQQEQLFQAAKMASVGTLVSGVAHEINNPNTSILLNADILKKMWHQLLPLMDRHAAVDPHFTLGGMPYADLKQRIPRLLEDMRDNAGRIRNIVSELKDFARLSPPDLNDSVDINAAVNKACGLTANLIKKSTDHFSVMVGSEIPPFRGNAQKVEQILINLLINACQSLTAREQEILVQTRFDPAGGTVTVEVRDGGRGIPPELLDRIKDPFFTTKQGGGSTGLGLAISEKIIQDHGGKLIFSSTSGKGTTATLQFPAQT